MSRERGAEGEAPDAPPSADSARIPPAEIDLPTAWRVICTRSGMWRGGRQWTADSLVPAAEMPAGTLAALQADPTFAVAPVFGDPAEAAAPAAA